MKIEVLGTGCAKCEKLKAMAEAAAGKLGVPCKVEHVTGIEELVERGIMLTPALAINGEVVVAGRVPCEAELTTLIGTALA